MVFENGVENIQAAAYNGAHTVYGLKKFNNAYLEKVATKVLMLLKKGFQSIVGHFQKCIPTFITLVRLS